MKPLNQPQLGALYKSNPVAYHLYCAMAEAHRAGDTKRRDEIREFTAEDEQQAVLDIANRRMT